MVQKQSNKHKTQELKMRAIAAMLLGYYPLPASEAARVRAALAFPAEPVTALDPCAGTGAALREISSGANVVRLGIELDSLRAEQACSLLDHVIHGDALQTRCPSGSISLLYLNPPYGGDLADYQRERMELIFLEHTYHWLKPEGTLILVIPQEQLCVCAQVLSFHFRDVRVFRLTAEDSIRYHQIAVFAARRGRGKKANANNRETRMNWQGIGDGSLGHPPMIFYKRNFSLCSIWPTFEL
jgi:16S rRNA G966 N2-methylase RsmD